VFTFDWEQIVTAIRPDLGTKNASLSSLGTHSSAVTICSQSNVNTPSEFSQSVATTAAVTGWGAAEVLMWVAGP
jgi:hypothetical protein